MKNIILTTAIAVLVAFTIIFFNEFINAIQVAEICKIVEALL